MTAARFPEVSRPAGPGRRGLAFALATVLIDMVGIGLIVPVVPDLIREVTGDGLSGAAWVGGLLFAAYSAMQFLFGPLVGNLSDALGRRPVLLVSVAGLGLDYLVTAFAPSLPWFFAGRIVAGACGASVITVNAYIADVTPPEERGRAFGLIGAAFGVGFVVGPALGGAIGQLGPRAPFLAAAGFSLLNFAFGALALPESLPREARRPFALARANPLGALRALRGAPGLGALGLATLLMALAQSAYLAVWAFSLEARYGWGTGAVGLSLAAVGVGAVAVQGFAVGPAVARLGERRTALLGLAVGIGTTLGYALAPEGWMVFPLIAIGSLQGVVPPALTALASRAVPADRQGEVQGALGSLQGVAAVVGPPLMAGIFTLATRPGGDLFWPGAPYAAASALLAMALAVLSRSRPA